jgi:4-hydroxy-tetrahydrodipicolinate reductase
VINVAVAGALGKMGKLICNAILENKDMQLAGIFEHPEHPDINSLITFNKDNKLKLCRSLEEVATATPNPINVCVDFTLPEATEVISADALQLKIPQVIGTTGLNEAQIDNLIRIAEKIPVVYSPNMSIGINLLLEILSQSAKALGLDYNAEIIEIHHKHKKDAPSGTALKLGEVLAKARKQSTDDLISGRTGPRVKDEINMHALRMSEIPGEHKVYFAGNDELIEIGHRTFSRKPFVGGVIAAIYYIIDKQPGMYNMQQVLNI